MSARDERPTVYGCIVPKGPNGERCGKPTAGLQCDECRGIARAADSPMTAPAGRAEGR